MRVALDTMPVQPTVKALPVGLLPMDRPGTEVVLDAPGRPGHHADTAKPAALERARLDALQQALWAKAMEGDLPA